MRTARLLTVSQHARGGTSGVYPSMYCPGCVARGRGCLSGGVWPGGVSGQGMSA